jgi:hypothetical protein
VNGALKFFWGIKAYICALGYESCASLKTSHACGLPCEENSMGSVGENVKVSRWPIYRLQSLVVTELT